MSKGQKRLADYVTRHYDKAAFMTAAELGRAAKVSESTAVRFAAALGYSGFPQFHRTLEKVVRNKLNTAQKRDIAWDKIPQDKVLDTVMSGDVERVRVTLDEIDHDAFDMAVDTILSAKTIYVIGMRSCEPLASFLSFYLNEIFPDVRQVRTNSASEIFEQMIRISEEDVIVGISFPRYSMRTLKALEFANNRSARVITITDSLHSPLNLYSSCNLIARSDMASIVDSLTAAMSLINALVVALCVRRQDEVMDILQQMEKVRDEYQTFAGDEINEAEDTFDVEPAPQPVRRRSGRKK